jgi:hypothetical protein
VEHEILYLQGSYLILELSLAEEVEVDLECFPIF